MLELFTAVVIVIIWLAWGEGKTKKPPKMYDKPKNRGDDDRFFFFDHFIDR